MASGRCKCFPDFSRSAKFLDTFHIPRYNIFIECKNALIGSSTCAYAAQREDRDGGTGAERVRRAVHGGSLYAAAWKASGSIPFEREGLAGSETGKTGFHFLVFLYCCVFRIRKERVSTVIWKRLYGRSECREI